MGAREEAVRGRAAADLLELLERSAEDKGRRLLIAGGTVVTMDDEIGDLVRGDVLLEGGEIAAVGADLGDAAADGQALVVPADGMIVMPGLQDTHRHCWQTQFRRLVSGCDLKGYEAVTHLAIGPHYRPEDVYAGTLLGTLGAIDGGVTTLLDLFHNSRSAAHSDAAIEAVLDAGIRAVHVSAPPLVGEWDEQWPGDMARLKEQYCSSDDQLVTLRSGVFGWSGIGGPAFALSPETLAFARGLGVEISVDGVFGPAASANLEELGRAGLLGPDITLIHCNDLTETAWQLIAAAGVQISLCPTSDTQIGIFDALPPVQQALDHNLKPGLSVDVECALSTDMFSQMQSIYTTQRMLAFNRAYHGDDNAPDPITVRAVLEMATRNGAQANGLLHKTGTLTPGKQADIVLLTANAINTMPLNNATATIVLAADTANIDTVLIAGQPRKWQGQLLHHNLDQLKHLIYDSRDHLIHKSGYTLDVIAGDGRVGGVVA